MRPWWCENDWATIYARYLNCLLVILGYFKSS